MMLTVQRYIDQWKKPRWSDLVRAAKILFSANTGFGVTVLRKDNIG